LTRTGLLMEGVMVALYKVSRLLARQIGTN
jgi:hypothetical protein